MFTGIIRELGGICDHQDKNGEVSLILPRPASFVKLREGDSVAVNGVCLTVLDPKENTWRVRLMHETLFRTNLDNLTVGSPVNLELPLAAGERFDGHFVQGHVDGVGDIADIQPAGDDRVISFRLPKALLPYCAPKGSVALNGVSLTVVDVLADSITVSFMPYTLRHTTFGRAQIGERVNVEVDLLAKYAAQFIRSKRPSYDA